MMLSDEFQYRELLRELAGKQEVMKAGFPDFDRSSDTVWRASVDAFYDDVASLLTDLRILSHVMLLPEQVEE